jgi:putative hydrolase of the HAD superfamily
MIKAIIFDCFGVLTTEAWLVFKAKHFGHDPKLIKQATGISKQADAGLISRDDEVEKTASLAGISPEEFKDAVNQNVPDEELFEYIRELKLEYKIGMLSNISDNYLHHMFSQEQLGLFDAVTLSYKTGFVKPQLAAYGAAARDLGVETTECIMIDDLERNVAGAREAGMQAVLYKNVAQLRQDLAKLLKA